jgi:hypothetical protein
LRSPSYICKTLSNDTGRLAVSSPTLIITATSEGIRSVASCTHA